MNNVRRKQIQNALEILQVAVEEERDSLDNQEESFGETQRWQDADELCTEGEDIVSTLEDLMERW